MRTYPLGSFGLLPLYALRPNSVGFLSEVAAFRTIPALSASGKVHGGISLIVQFANALQKEIVRIYSMASRMKSFGADNQDLANQDFRKINSMSL